MTNRTASVAMTSATEKELSRLLVRDDGQEDICLATYRPSTGLTRDSALIAAAVPPEPGDRHVHGNATVTAEYILRAAAIAQQEDCGLILIHTHPRASEWQFMSGPDRDTESSYAYLVREMTGLPLVGMTLATQQPKPGRPVIGTSALGDRLTAPTPPMSGSWENGLPFRGTTSYAHGHNPPKGNCAL